VENKIGLCSVRLKVCLVQLKQPSPVVTMVQGRFYISLSKSWLLGIELMSILSNTSQCGLSSNYLLICDSRTKMPLVSSK
jgi:hypothetical protein